MGWIFLSIASHRQVALPAGKFTDREYFVSGPQPADPGYLGIILNWDGQWYQQIAEYGYPLPGPSGALDSQGRWTWAFPPLYPFILRIVTALTGLSVPIAASIVSIVCGAAAMVLLYRLILHSGSRFLAAASVVVASMFVSGPLFQMAYSESLSLLLIMLFFTTLRARSYGWAFIVVAAIGLTRIITPALAVVVAVHVWSRYRNEGGVPTRDLLKLAALATASVLWTFGWLAIASAFIGVDAAMTRTSGQRANPLGYFSDALNRGGGLITFLAVCIIVLVLILHSFSRFSEDWGNELRSWSVAYPVYVLAATPMMVGTLRYLLLSPMLGMLAVGSPRRATRSTILTLALIVLLLAAGQFWYANSVVAVPERFNLVP